MSKRQRLSSFRLGSFVNKLILAENLRFRWNFEKESQIFEGSLVCTVTMQSADCILSPMQSADCAGSQIACHIYIYSYTYKRVVCVCLLVCLSAFYRPQDICPLCGAASEYSESRRAGAVVAGGPARAGKHAQREQARACRTTSQRKNRTLMPFKNKTVRARACCRIRNCRDFQKREKENQHATSQVQFTVCLLLECLLSESYWIVLDLWSEPTLVSSYTYKRAECGCLFVCPLFIGHTTFVHFAALPPSPRAGAVTGGQAWTARANVRACRTTSQRKNRTLMPFKNKTVRARMLSYT